MTDAFAAALNTYGRIAVTGGPLTGKTTLCSCVSDRPVFHTDDYIDLGWSEASAHVAGMVNHTPGKLVVEGVAVPRALRKGMLVDAIVWLDKRLGEYARGQATMARGVLTVFQQWRRDNLHVPVIILGPRSVKEVAEPNDFDDSGVRIERRQLERLEHKKQLVAQAIARLERK